MDVAFAIVLVGLESFRTRRGDGVVPFLDACSDALARQPSQIVTCADGGFLFRASVGRKPFDGAGVFEDKRWPLLREALSKRESPVLQFKKMLTTGLTGCD